MTELLPDIASAFIHYIQFEKRYSIHTVKAYEKDLQDFFHFLEKEYDALSLQEVSAPIIRTWLSALKKDGLNARSLNRKISTLKSLYKFSIRSGKLTQNPMDRIIAPKPANRLPVYVERLAIDQLLHQVEFPDTFEGQTERLIIEILYNTGIRRSELVNLKLSQIDWSGSTFKVLGKGSKERIIPVSPDLLHQVRTYMEAKSRLPAADTVFVLVTPIGKPLYPQYVYRVVKKMLGLVTTVAKKSPHVLRHTFATHLTNNGADLNAVKELLGHASLAATQVYVHNTIEQLKIIYDQAHPKSGE